MEDEVNNTVSVHYFSDTSKIPLKLINLGEKYNCLSIKFQGEKISSNPSIYAYEFRWSDDKTYNINNFIRDVNSLEDTLLCAFPKQSPNLI